MTAGLPLLLVATGCGAEAEAPAWTRLSASFDPQSLIRGTPEYELNGHRVVLEQLEGRDWLRCELDAREWQREDDSSASWSVLSPLQGFSREPEAIRLEADGHTFRRIKRRAEGRPLELTEGSFGMDRGRLRLRLARGEDLPARLSLRIPIPRGHRGEDGAWRLNQGRRFSGEALPIWPGESFELTLDIAPESSLSFATCNEPIANSSGRETRSARFRIELDDELIFESSEPEEDLSSGTWHRVALPPEGRTAARLRFSVTGDPGYTSFFAPVIGPAESGGYGARPWGEARPDIVVFLADTFRADNMRAYGGTRSLTPALDAWAEDSLLFERSWASGTFTLSTHASLFTGMFPRQAGVVGRENALAEEFVTVAEHFRDHGYRTAAVTDSLLVSRLYGMDQGFEWFDEIMPFNRKAVALESTLERVKRVLDADDGRPLLLFIQTYQTHIPYVVSDRTRAQHGERLGIRGDFFDLQKRLKEPGRETRKDRAERRQVLERLEALYLGSVIDLDRAMASFRRDLEERGLLTEGFFLFTSDHGEGFGEHDVIFHMNTAWEELARVPLFIDGPGIEGRRVRYAASSIDFAPTLAAMAGLSPRGNWLGTSLLALDHERPALVFECRPRPRSTFALIEGAHKIIGFEDIDLLRSGALLGAFDLDEDPAELRDLKRTARWPADLLERHGRALEGALQPVADPVAQELDAEALEDLRDMGYGG